MRFYGGARFDSEATTQQEWSRFGALFFILPLLELQVLARCSRPSSLCVYACVCVCAWCACMRECVREPCRGVINSHAAPTRSSAEMVARFLHAICYGPA